MDLRQLSYFLRIAERQSITVAALELNVAQPTLTKSMRLLEEDLGTVLFRRLPRGVELTDAGRHLVKHAEYIAVQMAEARAELDALRKGDVGMVTIGAGPAWLRRHLPAAIARCIAVWPDLRIKIVGGFDEALLKKLRRGEIDFVVAETPWSRDIDDLEVDVVASADLKVVAREAHPLSGRSEISMEDTLAFPWVLPVPATRARQRLDSLFQSRNLLPPEPAVETGSMAFMLAMIRASDALTYTVSTTTLPPDGAGLILLAVPDMVSEREAAVIRRKGSWTSPAATRVIEALRAICQADPCN